MLKRARGGKFVRSTATENEHPHFLRERPRRGGGSEPYMRC